MRSIVLLLLATVLLVSACGTCAQNKLAVLSAFHTAQAGYHTYVQMSGTDSKPIIVADQILTLCGPFIDPTVNAVIICPPDSVATTALQKEAVLKASAP